MKVLLSAYACEPNKGSEPGVGWNWALEIAKLGHEVWVLTRSNNRENIEAELAKMPAIPNLHFEYYDLPLWIQRFKRGSRLGLVNAYYGLWQWGAYQKAKKLHKQIGFDRAHHITFAVFRQPSLMFLLGCPFYFGPVGGGERAPWALRKNYSLRGHLVDIGRDAMNFFSRFDPLLQWMLARAEKIIVKTPETKGALPQKYASKVLTLSENGIHPNRIPKTVPAKATPRRLLYVGRFIDLKGMDIGIRAFAGVCRAYPEATLTMVGKGPAGPRWRKLADQLGVNNSIQWIDWVNQQELETIYSAHDLFFFPSLHDSGGTVVLEALSRGLPCIVLNLGGPGVIVDDSCGIRVEALESETDAVEGLSRAIMKICNNDTLYRSLSQGALEHARQYAWERIIDQVYPSVFKEAEKRTTEFPEEPIIS